MLMHENVRSVEGVKWTTNCYNPLLELPKLALVCLRW